jgi:hypothetical protein
MTIPPDRSDQIMPGQPIRPGPATPQAPGAGFQGYMGEAQGAPGKVYTPAPGTPASVIGAQPFNVQTAGPSLDNLISQIGTSQDSLAMVRSQLKTNNLQFKRSQQHLLRNKLSDASTYLRAANSKLGADVPQMPSQAGAKPIERFLNFVTDGESQLASAQQKIQDMQKKGDQMRPGDFLLVQVKMSQAQQEIEYSSVLLSKVIDSIKATLNIAL